MRCPDEAIVLTKASSRGSGSVKLSKAVCGGLRHQVLEAPLEAIIKWLMGAAGGKLEHGCKLGTHSKQRLQQEHPGQ